MSGPWHSVGIRRPSRSACCALPTAWPIPSVAGLRKPCHFSSANSTPWRPALPWKAPWKDSGASARIAVVAACLGVNTNVLPVAGNVGGLFDDESKPCAAKQPILAQGESWCGGLTHEVLRHLFPEQFPTSSRAKKYCRKHRVFVDGKRANTTAHVAIGQQVVVLGRKEHPPNPLLESVQVLHDDGHIAVLVKPEGVFTHGHGRGRSRKSLTHVIQRLLAPTPERDALAKPSPGHRLDKATGGLVVFVKTLRAAQGMQGSFEFQQSVDKRYRAVVTGRMEAAEGIIDSPVNGKPCQTRYAVISHTFQPHLEAWTTLVDLFPATGRRHQLRRHLAGAGHPIVGEPRYHRGGAVAESSVFEGWLSKGLFLWALELRFAHPVTGERLHFCIDGPDKFAEPVGRAKRRRRRRGSGGGEGTRGTQARQTQCRREGGVPAGDAV